MKIRERQKIYEAADTQRVNNLLDSVASVPFTAISNVLSQPTGAHSVDHCSSYRRRNISSPHREAAGAGPIIISIIIIMLKLFLTVQKYQNLKQRPFPA